MLLLRTLHESSLIRIEILHRIDSRFYPAKAIFLDFFIEPGVEPWKSGVSSCDNDIFKIVMPY